MSPRARAPRSGPEELDVLIARLDPEDLRVIVGKAAERYEDVARAIRLVATRGSGDLSQLRAEIDRGLRTTRYLGYRESGGWAMQARPVVKVILKADDSDGLIGDLARELLDLHARACDAGNADPIKLARWMVRFRVDDQDFFEADPVRYADALGELGLAAYRREVKWRVEAGGGDSFAATYAQERLAVLDGDTEALVGLLGGDLSRPYQFIRVAEAMAELGCDDNVLSWATRGITETSGWQVPGAHPEWDPGPQRWMRLAESRESSASGDVLAVYLRLADLQAGDNRKGSIRASRGNPKEGVPGRKGGGPPKRVRHPPGSIAGDTTGGGRRSSPFSTRLCSSEVVDEDRRSGSCCRSSRGRFSWR